MVGLLQEALSGVEGVADTGREEGVTLGRTGFVDGFLVGLNVGSNVSTVGS